MSLFQDLYSDALEKAVINSNTGITNSLFSLVPCVEIKMLVQPVSMVCYRNILNCGLDLEEQKVMLLMYQEKFSLA